VKIALAALGYDPGSKDNSLNDQAIRAIKAFQRDHGLPATGQISPELLASLLASRFEASNASKTATSPGSARKLKLYASGSGFYVSALGDIVTNQHVVEGCAEIRLPDGSALQVVRIDKANDLALLRSGKPASEFARFRDGRGVRTGEAIM